MRDGFKKMSYKKCCFLQFILLRDLVQRFRKIEICFIVVKQICFETVSVGIMYFWCVNSIVAYSFEMDEVFTTKPLK